MTDRKLSPAKITKERIDKDKREADRLVKRIQKLVKHESPGLWGYVVDTKNKTATIIDTATKEVIEVIKATSSDISWATEKAYQKAYEHNTGKKVEVEDKVKEAEDTVSKDVEDKVEKVSETVSSGSGNILDWVVEIINNLRAILDRTATALGTAFDNAMDALISLPDFLATIKEEVKGFFSFNPEEFVNSYRASQVAYEQLLKEK